MTCDSCSSRARRKAILTYCNCDGEEVFIKDRYERMNERYMKNMFVIITIAKSYRHKAAAATANPFVRGKYFVTNDGKKLNARMWETSSGKQAAQTGKNRMGGYMRFTRSGIAFRTLLLEVNSMQKNVFRLLNCYTRESINVFFKDCNVFTKSMKNI